MNSEGRIGVIVQWLRPKTEIDFDALVEGTDFIVVNPAKVCPRTDGLPVQFDDPSYEWLLRKDGDSVSPDYNIYIENIVSRPTNTKDEELINYNVFLNERKLLRRSNNEIISIIREKENQANNAVLGEAGRNKLAMLTPAILVKVASGQSLNEYEQAVMTRMNEVNQRAIVNSSNAQSLIDVVNAGGTPDINQGWEYDNISEVGYPF